MSECAEADEEECGAGGRCAYDKENDECFAKQGALLAAALGHESRAAAGARSCHAIKSAAACAKAGTVEYDPAAARALFPLPAPAKKP
jgi:hypothetical protein